MAGWNAEAFVLAAGAGSRMKELTQAAPKPMLAIAEGLPLLEHVIRQLRAQGLCNLAVNLHHLPECIRGYFGDGARFGVRIEYSDESGELLETAGAVRKAAPLLADEFLLVYGDQLHFHDFRPLLELHRRERALATVTLKRTDLPRNGDLAALEPGSSRVARWLPRPHDVEAFTDGWHLNTGITALSRRILEFIPGRGPVSLDREVLPRLVREGRDIHGLATGSEILDIGTPEKLEAARAWFARRLDERPRLARALFLDRDGVIVEALPRGQYLLAPEQLRIAGGMAEVVEAARRLGYLILVATNQPQVSRGLLPPPALNALHDRIARDLDRPFDAFYVCPHQDSDGCGCRKPKPGLLLRAAREFAVDLERSYFAGDSDRDVLAGQAAGCRTIFVHNAYNASERAACRPDFEVRGIGEIAGLLEEAR